jgi:hypothetical protein
MALSHGPPVVTSGLVLALDVADRTSYPGTGTAWTDLSRVSGIGTLYNMEIPGDYTGSNPGFLSFDGTNEHVLVQNSSTLNPGTGSFTIICWANSDPNNGGDGWDMWVTKRITTTNGYYLGANSVNGVRFGMGNDQGTFINTGYISYTNNTWAMFTGILDVNANTQTVIRNNHEQSASITPAGGTYSNSVGLSIGADSNLNAFYTNGKISYVLIYNRALTSSEVTQNFNAIKDRFNI